MIFSEIIDSGFQERQLMDKVIIETTCGEVYSYVDGGGMIWVVENDWEESAGGDTDSGDKLIKKSLPKDKNTSMSMVGGEGNFRIKLVV